MKKIISLLTVMVLTLVFGAAFADDKAVNEKIWDSMFNTPLESTDVPDLYAFPKHETAMEKTGAIGAAAGGVRIDKGQAERDKIWDRLFNTPQKSND